jgi:CubicO group peptidase (beta-lactamase class C family)
MRSTIPRAAVLAFALVGVLAACGASSDDESTSASAPPSTSTTTTAVSTPAPATTDATIMTEATTTTAEAAASETTGPFAEISPIVTAFVEEHDLNGAGLIVVDREDGVLHHEHWGEFSEDRISLVASSSKMITAGVLLRLQDDGLLDIDAPVVEVADWGAGNPDITPAQLVSNSSGLVGLTPNPLYLPYLCMFDAADDLQGCAESAFTTAADDDDINPPDTEFDYGGVQWQVAGAVAEVASGRSWAELVDEIYVEPCELDALAYNNHFGQLPPSGFSYPTAFDADPSVLAPTENPNIEGGAYVTTGDYGKLLLMQLRDGRCGDTQVLSPEALATMHADRVGEVYGGDAWASDTGYGMGWWIDRETGYRSDAGAYGSVPWLDLDDGYGAYLVIEATSDLGGELAAELQPVIDEAVAATR